MSRLTNLMRKAHGFLRRSGVLSRLGMGMRRPRRAYIRNVKKGYGRRRRRGMGGSLMPVGGALHPVGFSRMRNLPMNY
jgi:hypothetical protein